MALGKRAGLTVLLFSLGCSAPTSYQDIVTALTGRVIDQSTQAPLRGVIVRTEPPSQQVSTDEGGVYRLVLPARTGETIVYATKAGYLEGRTTAFVVEGQTTLLDFTLTAMGDSTCGDGRLTTGETDVDCGGLCRPCAVGQRCDDGGDCETELCIGGVCESGCDDPRRTGDDCQACLPRFAGPECRACSERFQGRECRECSERFAGANCQRCSDRFTGVECDRCSDRFTGPNCTECTGRLGGEECRGCAPQFAGPDCERCAERFDGPQCEQCAERYAGSDCMQCSARFAGPDCAQCSARYGGDGCRRCSERFDGPECDLCSASFSGPNCEECRVPGMRPPDCVMCTNGGCGATCDACPTGMRCGADNECAPTGDPGSPCGRIAGSNPPVDIACNEPLRPVTNSFGDELDPVCLERWPGGYCVNACIFTVNDGFECQRFNLTMIYYRPDARYCCAPRCASNDECRDGYVCRTHFNDQPAGCVPAE